MVATLREQLARANRRAEMAQYRQGVAERKLGLVQLVTRRAEQLERDLAETRAELAAGGCDAGGREVSARA